MPVLFGACWGVAQILFGISVNSLGMSLTYGIVVGMGAALGTLVLMIVLGKNELHRNAVKAFVLGIALMTLVSAGRGDYLPDVYQPNSIF